MQEQQAINIRLVGKGRKPTLITRSVEGVEYVEQLLFRILDEEQISPLYRHLFAFMLEAKPPLWLAPDTKITELLKLCKRNPLKFLELRMRYRPSCLTKLLILDKAAFKLVFYQIRYDFMYKRFNDARRDLVLINSHVLGLIIAEMKLYALERQIKFKDIFKYVRLHDFIPRSASRWQRNFSLLIKSKIDLVTAEKEMGDTNIFEVMCGFMNSFFLNVSPEYGAETYQVTCPDGMKNHRFSKIKLRYHQTDEDSRCIIEGQATRETNHPKDPQIWVEIADINSICYGTLRDNIAEINHSNERPIRLQFQNEWYAKSFLSAVSQYYRLMRKWNFVLCREVSSPHLDFLKQTRCHGPIGFESARYKLDSVNQSEAFLIRESIEQSNRFIIDTNIDFCSIRFRITIHVEYIPERKVFIKTNHTSNRNAIVSVLLNYSEYSNLKSFTNDVQIKIEGDFVSDEPARQLKHWIASSDNDECPSLLLSLSNKRLMELEESRRKFHSLDELPKWIPDSMLEFKEQPIELHGRFISVKYATLNGGRGILVKEPMTFRGTSSPDEGISQNYFTQCRDLYSAQLRIWAFLKSGLFAETIGLNMQRLSLYQEYFSLGSLDCLLSRTNLKDVKKLNIGCQLSMALLYLLDKQVIHGKIRCHNVFLKCLEPIQVKITDGLGAIDNKRDQAFIPTEYLNLPTHISLLPYDHRIDIWALGTTLWQIYSNGRRPPAARYANTLVQPPGCPDEVWDIIESCWQRPELRATPQSVYRDLNDCLAWKDDEERLTDLAQVLGKSDDIPLSDMNKSNNNLCPSRASSSNATSGSSSLAVLLPKVFPGIENEPPSTSSTYAVKSPTANGVIRKQKSLNPINFKSPATRVWNGFRSLSYKSKRNQGGSQVDTDLSNCHTLSSRSSLSSDSEAARASLQARKERNLIITTDKLKLSGEIGRGSCGVVYRGFLYGDTEDDKQVVAIKCINSKIKNISDIEDLKREFEILKSLDHRNIVKTLGLVNEDDVMLVTEYMPLGGLLARIKNLIHESLSNMPLLKYAQDIADGMRYLESKKIVHRDLALRNILLKDLYEAKICDFGLAQKLGPDDNKYKLKTERALPLRWYAPEVLTNWTFDHKTDVWSYGIVLWEMYSGGCNPQYSKTHADLIETLKHERLMKPRGCPDNIYELMQSCWAYDPQDRCTFSQVYERVSGFLSTL